MRMSRLFAPAAIALACAGCANLGVAVDGTENGVTIRGLVDGHLRFDGLRDYDQKILKAGLLDFGEGDDWVHFDIWPLAGAGVGLAGARARLLMVEAGLGTLWYEPQPFRSPALAEEPDDPIEMKIDVDEEDEVDVVVEEMTEPSK